jgi:hypothetical protein
MPAEATAESGAVTQAIRTPRAAALAGIAFSVLFAITLVLVRTAVPADPEAAEQWLSDGSRHDTLLLGLGLVPFADTGPSHTERAGRHGV